MLRSFPPAAVMVAVAVFFVLTACGPAIPKINGTAYYVDCANWHIQDLETTWTSNFSPPND